MRTLETERLILRGWEERDLDDFYEYAKVEGVGEMAGWPHHTSKDTSKKILQSFIEEGDVYALVLKENNKVIGSLGIHKCTMDKNYKANVQREIGYVLSKAYWGKGLMIEAVRVAIHYAFEELGADVLWCGHFDCNVQSRSVVEKSGFKLYGDKQFKADRLGKVFEGKSYLLIKEDYEGGGK